MNNFPIHDQILNIIDIINNGRDLHCRSTWNMESLVVHEDIGENSISFVSAICKNNIQKSWIRDGGIRTKTEGMMTNIYIRG